MQEAPDGIQSFVDASGGRWRAAADVRRLLQEQVAPALALDRRDGESGLALVALKKSKRREVWAASAPGLPPLLLKRYPPRSGWIGRGRDRLRTRAAAELGTARKVAARGLLTPRALGCVEPPSGDGERPSWFVGVRLIGAKPLGTWLEEHHRPGDGAPAKLALARRALDELARLHRAGLWHRDFHGGNLLLHEGAGPAAALYLIDLHAAIDLGASLGSVPARLRASDAAILLHSLRYAFSESEIEALVADAARFDLEPGRLRRALERRRETQARSRGARAFVESSRFAQTTIGGRRASHDRAVAATAIEAWLAGHDAALFRAGRRSRLSRHDGEGGAVIVKEFVGAGARRRARAAFRNGVAAQARDLPTAAPLACVVGGASDPAFLVTREVAEATPLHVLAQRIPRDDADRARAAAIALGVLDLLVALVQRRFVHPDLSPKNLLVRAPAGISLVDLDAARPGARWPQRRLLRALAQVGDVPARAFSTPQRLRFLAELKRRLALDADVATLARESGRRLRRRQHLAPEGGPRRDFDGLSRLPTLHLFGNWKWTGPAEPAVALAEALAPESRLLVGHCPFPDLGQPIAEKAAARGVPHQVLDELRKHWNPLRTGAVAAELLPVARAFAPAVIHVHLDGDHAATEAVARELPASSPAPRPHSRPAIVRHVHDAGPHPARTRRLLRRAELLVAPTLGLARALEQELGRPPLDVARLETSVDLARFRFTAERRERGRARLGLAPGELAFGIVARIQSHRRFELLFDAWAKLRENPPKLVLLGRGTREEELARAPVARLGLGSVVLFPGYQEGDAYVEALAACDAGIFLVPGTDVSCRAVREWMAMGRAVVATKRAPLPELIDDGGDGRLVDEDADAFAAALRECARDGGAWLAEAGAKAAEKAKRRFDPARLRSSARALDRMAALALPGMAARFRGEADVVAAVRPGRLDELLLEVGRDGIDPDRVIAFDPWRSRDAGIELLALANAARPRRIVLEAHPEFDRTIDAELARLAGDVRRLGRA
jgi:glycosyltransferase involved in cell wall biosynthesis/tRNA A-37 threonylcarbamoyl transferase component Bud32